MIIEKIEIGKIWGDGFGGVVFECRPAHTQEDFISACMYTKEFDDWTSGKKTLDEIRELLDPYEYTQLKKMSYRALFRRQS